MQEELLLKILHNIFKESKAHEVRWKLLKIFVKIIHDDTSKHLVKIW